MTASNIHRDLVETIETNRANFVHVGKQLSQLKKKSEYKKAVGDGIDTWQSYLAQPEIGMSLGEASKLIRIYEEFVERLGFKEEFVAEIPRKNLEILLTFSQNCGDAIDLYEVIEEAKALSHRDFKERHAERKYGDNHPRTFSYVVMRKDNESGNLSRVREIESEVIKDTFGLV